MKTESKLLIKATKISLIDEASRFHYRRAMFTCTILTILPGGGGGGTPLFGLYGDVPLKRVYVFSFGS